MGRLVIVIVAVARDLAAQCIAIRRSAAWRRSCWCSASRVTRILISQKGKPGTGWSAAPALQRIIEPATLG